MKNFLAALFCVLVNPSATFADYINPYHFSADSKSLYSTADTFTRWDIASGAETTTKAGTARATYSEDGRYFAATSSQVQIVRTSDLKVLTNIKRSCDSWEWNIYPGAFLADGKSFRIYVCGGIATYNFLTAKLEKEVPIKTTLDQPAGFLSPTGKFLILLKDDFVHLYDAETGKFVHELESPDFNWSHARAYFSQNDDVVVGFDDSKVVFWNRAMGKKIQTIGANTLDPVYWNSARNQLFIGRRAVLFKGSQIQVSSTEKYCDDGAAIDDTNGILYCVRDNGLERLSWPSLAPIDFQRGVLSKADQLILSPDGRYLLGYYNQAFTGFLYQVEGFKAISGFESILDKSQSKLKFSDDGNFFGYKFNEFHLHLVRSETGATVWHRSFADKIIDFKISPNNKWFSVRTAQKFYIFDLTTPNANALREWDEPADWNNSFISCIGENELFTHKNAGHALIDLNTFEEKALTIPDEKGARISSCRLWKGKLLIGYWKSPRSWTSIFDIASNKRSHTIEEQTIGRTHANGYVTFFSAQPTNYQTRVYSSENLDKPVATFGGHRELFFNAQGTEAFASLFDEILRINLKDGTVRKIPTRGVASWVFVSDDGKHLLAFFLDGAWVPRRTWKLSDGSEELVSNKTTNQFEEGYLTVQANGNRPFLYSAGGMWKHEVMFRVLPNDLQNPLQVLWTQKQGLIN